MLTERYDPVDLFALVPQLSLRMEPELAQLDRLLEDDVLFQAIKADLGQRYPQTLVRGRPSTPVEVILRMLVVKRLYGFSYEQTEYFVAESLVLRHFCRLGLERAPDDTTLIRWANLITPQTVEQMNDRAVALARALKVTRGRKLRVDTTAVETNIHHPTDGSLLADGVRVLGRLVRRAKAAVGEASGLGARAFATHTRSARKWVRVIHGLARRVRAAAEQAAKGVKRTAKSKVEKPPTTVPVGETPAEKKRKSAQEAMKEAYGRLITVAQQSVAQAQRVAAVLEQRSGTAAKQVREQIATFVPRVEQVIGQARRRVIEGVAVPAKEKLTSLFEAHTQIVKRGKPGRDVEFGRKVKLDEVEGGIISGYAVLEEAGPDAPHLKASLEQHEQQFGQAPELLVGDRGFWTRRTKPRRKRRG